MLDSPTRISEKFDEVRLEGRMAFMPFITAGDPDLAATQQLIRELARRGVDLIEVGFPYSDPIADGPVIQASYTRALEKKIQVADIFRAIAELKPDSSPIPPLVAMVSYAIVFRIGPEEFVKQAAHAGFCGLIVPDLPADGAGEFGRIVRSHGLDLICLIAPTTSRARTVRIVQAASGFLYCISVAGTTGVRDELPAELRDQLSWLKTQTKLPLAVGFGISRPEQAAQLRGVADGIIVGSAFVRRVAEASEGKTSVEAMVHACGELAAELVNAVRAEI
ncbi:MAG TPA: tryptophan synthase subunit alpha [Planctomycetaceae bacterium]|nr:tryptophan synthase subunit alpha [Planctomycetaceae bacterium]